MRVVRTRRRARRNARELDVEGMAQQCVARGSIAAERFGELLPEAEEAAAGRIPA